MIKTRYLYKFNPLSEQNPMIVNGQFCQSELNRYLSEDWKECSFDEIGKIKEQAAKETAVSSKIKQPSKQAKEA
tara:strand:+ start:369 stop:590 length:222 start_codon:yes stop_codon:yes gene_type:complete